MPSPLGVQAAAGKRTAYAYLDGSAGVYLSTPDAAALDITGDIEVRVLLAPDAVASGAAQAFVSKFDATPNQRSWWCGVAANGVLYWQFSTNGTSVTSLFSTVAPTWDDGDKLWLSYAFDVDNGASQHAVTFSTSTDGENWSQLGSTVTAAGATSLFSSSADLLIGSLASGGAAGPTAGRFYAAQVLAGIDGTPVLDWDLQRDGRTGTSLATLTGQTITAEAGVAFDWELAA